MNRHRGRELQRNFRYSHRPVAGFQAELALTKSERLTEPWLQKAVLRRYNSPTASRRLRGFHIFGVFTEARFAVAPGAMVERLLCLGHIRLFAFPGFKHRGL
jgi:hypothetical protein